MKITNTTQNTVLADSAFEARGFLARAKGLLEKKQLTQGQALVIPNCQAIHMFFMRFAIDAIFVGKNNIVVGVCKNLKPFQLSPVFFKASFVIELPAGTIDSTQTQIGDKIRIEG